jgi:hypothetical protein
LGESGPSVAQITLPDPINLIRRFRVSGTDYDKTYWGWSSTKYVTLGGFNPFTQKNDHSDTLVSESDLGATAAKIILSTPLSWLSYVSNEPEELFKMDDYAANFWSASSDAMTTFGKGLPTSDPRMVETLKLKLALPSLIVWKETIVDGITYIWIDYTASKANGAKVSLAYFVGARSYTSGTHPCASANGTNPNEGYMVIPFEVWRGSEQVSITMFDRVQTSTSNPMYVGFNPYGRMYSHTSFQPYSDLVTAIQPDTIDFTDPRWANSISTTSPFDPNLLAWNNVWWKNVFFAPKPWKKENGDPLVFPSWFDIYPTTNIELSVEILKFPTGYTYRRTFDTNAIIVRESDKVSARTLSDGPVIFLGNSTF